MADLIVPETYLLMTTLIIKAKNELRNTCRFRFIKRLFLKYRIDDYMFTRKVTAEMQLKRGDMLYKNLLDDKNMTKYLVQNDLITFEEYFYYE